MAAPFFHDWEEGRCARAFMERKGCPRESWGADGRTAWADGRIIARWIGPDTIVLDCSGATTTVRGMFRHRQREQDVRMRMIEAVGAAAASACVGVRCQRMPAQGRRGPMRPSDVDLTEAAEREIRYIWAHERLPGGGRPPGTEGRVEALWAERERALLERRRALRSIRRWRDDVCLLARAWAGGRDAHGCMWRAPSVGSVGGRSVAVHDVGMRDRMNRYGSFARLLAVHGVPSERPHTNFQTPSGGEGEHIVRMMTDEDGRRMGGARP